MLAGELDGFWQMFQKRTSRTFMFRMTCSRDDGIEFKDG